MGETLRAMRDSEPRQHRATLAEVARLAGVSKSTASYAYSQPTRLSSASLERVLDAAQKLGFTGPSGLGRQLASGRSHVIAVVTAMLMDPANDDRFSLQVLEGLLRELASLGYGALVVPPATSEQNAALLRDLAFDGAICIRRRSHHHETNEILESRAVPVLQLDGNSEDDVAMLLEDSQAISSIVRKLRDDGHERIATVTLFFDRHALRSGIQQFDEALGAKPAAVRSRLAGFVRSGVIPSAVYECAGGSREDGYQAGRELLSLPERPTAIVCHTDLLAAGVIDAAGELGLRVPQDVSVSGFDALTGAPFDSLDLTTVDHSPLERGAASARWIVANAEGRVAPRSRIPATVRWGATTGPAPESP